MIQMNMAVCGAYQTNCYALWMDERDDMLLIDPGDDLGKVKGLIKSAGKRLTDVLLTHGHFDHILSVPSLVKETGCKVHIHPLDGIMLSSETQSAMNRYASSQPFVPIRADAPYPMDKRFSLEVCGITFAGIHTPGHSPGSVCLMVEDEKLLFSGDTLFAHGYGRYDLPGGNVDDLVQSLTAVLSLDRALTVYPGHGESDTMGNIAARYGM